jgi:glycosyltransferase involved in cell wall biosynthesis
MRILQICSGIGQLRGGAEQFCLKFSKKLQTSGYDITLVTGEYATSELASTKLKAHTIPDQTILPLRKLFFDYYSPKALLNFRDILSRTKPDIVHFHSFYGLGSYLAAVSADFVPTVITLHDTWGAFYDGAMITPKFDLTNSYWKLPLAFSHRKLNERFFRQCVLVSPSKWLKIFFSNHGGFSTPVYIPNGINTTNPITHYEKELLWVGALSIPKGLQVVIETLNDVATTSTWKLTIVGDGPLRPNLQKQFPQVNFVGYTDPSLYYRRASILIVSSICQENLPTVVLEGMSYGLCIVGNNLGGIAEIVTDRETGLLYRSRHDLKITLTEVMSNTDQLRRIGTAGYNSVKRKYGWATCMEQYKSLYHHLQVSNN